jgi:hypothetical protein
MTLIRICLFFCGLFAAFSAAAHHSGIGLYDRNTVGEVEGEITSIFWRNPHVRFGLLRQGENGQDEAWEVEFGSVNTVERLGVSRDSISVGDRITVSGTMVRNGLQAMRARSITMTGGEEVILQAGVEQRYGLTEEAFRAARNADASLRADIFRIWIPYSRPNTGTGETVYPLTPAGRAGLASWDKSLDPALQCIPPGLPTAMDNPYPIEFEDQGDTIIMRLEEWDGVRTIRMNPDDRRAPIQPRMGYSVGRQEGNTLFIETTNMDWRYVDDLGTPQSEDVVINEQFTLSEDGTRLAWEARISDPVNFTEPVVMEGEWVWVQGGEMIPYDCGLPETTE